MVPYDAHWFRSALNAMHDMVLIKGPRSQLLWANKAFLDYYGMSEEELRNIIDADHSDPDDTLQYVIDDQTVFDTAKDLDITRENVTDASGNSRFFHTIKSPICEAEDVVRCVGVSRMLEDTKINSRKIDHTDAKAFVAPLKSLTSGFPNPMIMVDVKKRIINSSPLWNQCFGHLKLTPSTFFEEVYASLSELHSAIDDCLELQTHAEIAVSHKNPEGSEKKYSVQISPWEHGDGTLGGVTIVATDISALHDKSVSLERANEELMQFSYRASHDLKGPLSTVKGLANFIVEDIASGDLEEAKENARRINSTMQRLEDTVIAILELAQADLKDENITSISLSHLMTDICEDLALQISESSVQIDCNFEVETLTCQPTRLRQIIGNLLSNAIKYRAPHREDNNVTISSRRSQNGVELCVMDNGLGLPEGSKDKIFDRFTRFHSGFEGSGLGLAIVQKHVDALGARIGVEDLSPGTAFRFIIPQPRLEVVS
ncbi:Adaptive-response sensory-kinase SasA [Roseobacter fucihabitans]|uniref:histidine kinase n=1 Tax=Roseobacter fucihabitans TaxID=1537242 RepID=A0ABZ2BX70_9RHOB|nr:PAS domain-containing sensor histidine kinase [Roseobacter litoralis]MBC6967200.1 Sensor protein CreC [Roseobacter litoralis]